MISEQYAHRYCCENLNLIENYQNAITDTTQIWDLHHRLEIQNDTKISVNELKTAGLYYHRPASELIFLTHSEHLKLHNHNFKPSVSSKLKNSESHKDKHHSEETKQKMKAKWKQRKENGFKVKSGIKDKHKVWNDESHTSYHFE